MPEVKIRHQNEFGKTVYKDMAREKDQLSAQFMQ